MKKCSHCHTNGHTIRRCFILSRLAKELTRAKYQGIDDARENAAREASRQARAHIAIGRATFDDPPIDPSDADIFG